MPVKFVVKNPGPEAVLDELLVPKQAAEFAGLSEGTMRARRHLGLPPSYIKVDSNGGVRYRRSRIDPEGVRRLARIAAASCLHSSLESLGTHNGQPIITGKKGRGRFAVATPGLFSDSQLAVKIRFSERQIKRWAAKFPDFPPRIKDPYDGILKRKTAAVGQFLLDREVHI